MFMDKQLSKDKYSSPSQFLILCVVTIGCLLTASQLHAETILFSENFDAENAGNGATNYDSFAQFSVPVGDVDLVGNGFADFFPGNGLYVDLDGTGPMAGTLLSKDRFSLVAGEKYRIQFDLANSDDRFGGTVNENMLTVIVGNYFEEFTRNNLQAFETITRVFTADDDGNASLIFEHTGGDQLGILLDNISLVAVPIPGVLWLFGVCTLGIARGTLRARKCAAT